MQIKTRIENWKVAGYYPFTPLLNASPEIGSDSGCVTPVIDATVPGSIYQDLMREGIIPDPYFERNSMLCEWVKDRFWVYRTVLWVEKKAENEKVLLRFAGLDYHAHIFLDQTKLGEHENMFTPAVFDITDMVRYGEEMVLKVVLECAPDEMSQIGYTERMHTQKARYTYKWDFGTRLVGMGIWREVALWQTTGATITETWTHFDGKALTVKALTDVPSAVHFALTKDGALIAEGEAKDGDKLALSIEAPELWYPNGYGAQPLYTLTTSILTENGEKENPKVETIGLRTISYRRPDGAREDCLPYIPVINGREIFIKGVNLVPIELMTGTETPEKREKLLSLVRDMGCDLVRVWGGGIIECEAFYDLCDKYGIMIWQEMPQSSSGISNVPSKDSHFLALLKETAIEAAKAKRNHVSLTFLSGGNELTDEHIVPSTFEDENLAMLKAIFDELCPDLLMLPTSASGPTEYGLPEPLDNHDVHGPWKYSGPEEHYRHYNRSPIALHSEFGVDGMTNEAMLETFLAPENREKIENVRDNLTWRHHGEWWDTYLYRDEPLFGDMKGNLSTFITVSQYMQAEALRYAIEANRRRQWRCAGSIIWQFNEPWPGVSGTNLVDYSAEPKPAYYFVKAANAPFHVSLSFDKITWREGETFRAKVYLHDDTSAIPSAGTFEADEISITLLDEHRIPAAAFDTSGVSFLVENLGRSFRIAIKVRKGDRMAKNEYLFFVLSEEHPTASVSAVRTFLREYLNERGH